MIEIAIPGNKSLQIEHLVLDYNGTLACDGEILPGVSACLHELAKVLKIHILTADTFGKAKSRLKEVPCEVSILPIENQALGKLDYIRRLDASHTVCIGNGRNDQLMIKEAVLGVVVILAEGAAVETLNSADVVCFSIVSALELLKNPLRLTATLRA
jgi:soluble P-type ATPase